MIDLKLGRSARTLVHQLTPAPAHAAQWRFRPTKNLKKYFAAAVVARLLLQGARFFRITAADPGGFRSVWTMMTISF